MVFERGLTPAAKGSADLLDVPYHDPASGIAPSAPLGSDGQPLKMNHSAVTLGELLPGIEFTSGDGQVYKITGVSSGVGGIEVKADPISGGFPSFFTTDFVPEWYGQPGPGPVAPETKPMSQFAVGQDAWTLGGKHGVVGSSGTLIFDDGTDIVPTSPLYVSDPLTWAEDTLGGPAAPGTVGALEPGDYFLKGAIVWVVDGPGAQTPVGNYVKAHAATDPGNTTEFLENAPAVKVPPPAAGPEVAAPGPFFSPLSDDELKPAKEMVAGLTPGTRFKMVKGAHGLTYRVAEPGPNGELRVAQHKEPDHVFAFTQPDIAVWVEDVPETELEPEKWRPPDQLPENTNSVPLSGLEVGTLVQTTTIDDKTPAIWRVVGPGQFAWEVELEVVATQKDANGEDTPGSVVLGSKSTFPDDYVFERMLVPPKEAGGYTEQDKILVQQLVDAEASGDEGAVEDAESAILDKLGIVGPGQGVGLEQFGAYIAGVSAQYGIDLEQPEVPFEGSQFPLAGGKVGDVIELGGKTYKITSSEGDLFQVSDNTTGEPAGAISKQNVAGTLVSQASGLQTLDTLEVGDHFEVEVQGGVGEYVVTKTQGPGEVVYAKKPGKGGVALPFGWSIAVKKLPAKVEADEQAGTTGQFGNPLKPYSDKSKSGGGYYFSDLGNLAVGAEFIDKTGTVYEVTSTSADGYYVRFVRADSPEVGEPTVYQAPAGARVKLPS